MLYRRESYELLSPVSGTQKGPTISDGNGEIRAPEVAHHGEVYADDFALTIKQRPTGAARGGLGVVDDPVR